MFKFSFYNFSKDQPQIPLFIIPRIQPNESLENTATIASLQTSNNSPGWCFGFFVCLFCFKLPRIAL